MKGSNWAVAANIFMTDFLGILRQDNNDHYRDQNIIKFLSDVIDKTDTNRKDQAVMGHSVNRSNLK